MNQNNSKDNLFARSQYPTGFSFNSEVAQVFDDMAQRSIPFYTEILRMSAEICAHTAAEEKYIYDIGCSTGNFAQALLNYFGANNFYYRGIDTSQPMLDIAQLRFVCEKERIQFLCADATEIDFASARAIVANYTLQFIKPLERLPLVKKIHDSLTVGGCFIMSEKILENDSDISRLFHELYYDFKKRNGYSELEISRKRDALENVLVPYRLEENLSLLRDAGFADAQIFFKWYNFASIVAFRKA